MGQHDHELVGLFGWPLKVSTGIRARILPIIVLIHLLRELVNKLDTTNSNAFAGRLWWYGTGFR